MGEEHAFIETVKRGSGYAICHMERSQLVSFVKTQQFTLELAFRRTLSQVANYDFIIVPWAPSNPTGRQWDVQKMVSRLIQISTLRHSVVGIRRYLLSTMHWWIIISAWMKSLALYTLVCTVLQFNYTHGLFLVRRSFDCCSCCQKFQRFLRHTNKQFYQRLQDVHSIGRRRLYLWKKREQHTITEQLLWVVKIFVH